MGRQSSRLYFQGKDHKDIYFQGHYHDAMYLTDSEGNATLVWEKLKDNIEIVNIPVDRLAYLNGLYIALSETTFDLYYGNDLKKMHRFESQGWGKLGMLIANEDEIILERLSNNNSYPYYALLSVPVIDENPNFKNLMWNRCKKSYLFNDATSPLVVGNNYKTPLHRYAPVSTIGVKLLHDNNRIVTYDGLLSNSIRTYGILYAAGKVILQGARYAVVAMWDSSFNIPVRFFELNDAETALELKEMYLADEIIEECEAVLKDEISKTYDKNNAYVGKYEYYSTPYFPNSLYGGVEMNDDNTGIFWMNFQIQAEIVSISDGTPSFRLCYMYLRISVNFENYEIIKYETIPAYSWSKENPLKIINGPQFFTPNWTVYKCTINGKSNSIRNGFLCYRKYKDFNGNFLSLVDVFPSEVDYGVMINSVAEIGEYIYVGIERNSSDGWIKKIIRINTSDNTWENAEIKIAGIIKDN